MLKPSKPNVTQARLMTVGEELRSGRERSGTSVKEAASQLYLSVNFLHALEDDAYSKLPEPIYVRGYIRSYARLLSLPADALVEKYNEGLCSEPERHQANAQSSGDIHRPIIKANNRNARFLIYLFTVVVVGLLLILTFSYWSHSDHDGSPSIGLEKVSIEGFDGRIIFEDFSSAGAEVSPIVQPQELDFSQVNHSALEEMPKRNSENNEMDSFVSFIDSLFVSAKEECWIKVTDGSGGTLHAALMSPGESLSLSGLAPFKVVVGNVDAISLNFNGENVNLGSYQSRQSRVAVVKLGG